MNIFLFLFLFSHVRNLLKAKKDMLCWTILTHNSLKYLKWNLAEEKVKGFFSIEIRNFKLWKMPKK